MIRGYELDKNGKYTYFISSEDGYVKIGSANNIFERKNQLQTANPHKLEISLFIRGDSRIERLMQTLFKNYHFNGEWFVLDGILKQFLEFSYCLTLIIEDLYFYDVTHREMVILN